MASTEVSKQFNASSQIFGSGRPGCPVAGRGRGPIRWVVGLGTAILIGCGVYIFLLVSPFDMARLAPLMSPEAADAFAEVDFLLRRRIAREALTQVRTMRESGLGDVSIQDFDQERGRFVYRILGPELDLDELVWEKGPNHIAYCGTYQVSMARLGSEPVKVSQQSGLYIRSFDEFTATSGHYAPIRFFSDDVLADNPELIQLVVAGRLELSASGESGSLRGTMTDTHVVEGVSGLFRWLGADPLDVEDFDLFSDHEIIVSTSIEEQKILLSKGLPQWVGGIADMFLDCQIEYRGRWQIRSEKLSKIVMHSHNKIEFLGTEAEAIVRDGVVYGRLERLEPSLGLKKKLGLVSYQAAMDLSNEVFWLEMSLGAQLFEMVKKIIEFLPPTIKEPLGALLSQADGIGFSVSFLTKEDEICISLDAAGLGSLGAVRRNGHWEKHTPGEGLYSSNVLCCSDFIETTIAEVRNLSEGAAEEYADSAQ